MNVRSMSRFASSTCNLHLCLRVCLCVYQAGTASAGRWNTHDRDIGIPGEGSNQPISPMMKVQLIYGISSGEQRKHRHHNGPTVFITSDSDLNKYVWTVRWSWGGECERERETRRGFLLQVPWSYLLSLDITLQTYWNVDCHCVYIILIYKMYMCI